MAEVRHIRITVRFLFQCRMIHQMLHDPCQKPHMLLQSKTTLLANLFAKGVFLLLSLDQMIHYYHLYQYNVLMGIRTQ